MHFFNDQINYKGDGAYFKLFSLATFYSHRIQK